MLHWGYFEVISELLRGNFVAILELFRVTLGLFRSYFWF